jgi:hypothetical protein
MGLVPIDLLPQGIDGMFVVVENTCGQAVTYEINGPVAYLGTGDLHQLRYNYLKQSDQSFRDLPQAETHRLAPCGKNVVSVMNMMPL